MQRYVWRPKEPAYFPQAYTPPQQPPFPPGLRFVKPDVIFEKKIDWWVSDAPYPYVDPRDSRRNKHVGQSPDDGVPTGPSHEDHQVSDQGPSDLEPSDQGIPVQVELELPRKTRGQKQKERRNTHSGRTTQHQRRNCQRYMKKMLIRSGKILKKTGKMGQEGGKH